MESACSLEESSVEDDCRAKTPVFFKAVGLGLGASAAAMSAVGIDDGALRRGTVLYDELTCAGEKPLTTLVVLLSEVPLMMESEDEGWAEVADATGVSSTVGVGVWGRGSGARCCGCGFSTTVGRGDMLKLRGWSSFFSLIVVTIFSRSSGVMCLSRPRLRLLAESCLRIKGREISRGLQVEVVVSNSRASSSTTESGLLERSGTSAV